MGRQLSFLNIQFRGILSQDADIRQLRAIALHIAFALAPDAALVCRIDRHVIDRAPLRFLAQERAHIRIGQALAVPEGQLRSPGVQDCAMRRRIRIIAEGLMHDIQQELDASAARGETEPVDARMLLLDIISLNVFPFIGFHIIEPVFGDLSGDRERFFEMRRAENVEIILRRLKKA